MCRCADRRIAILSGARALVRRDSAAVQEAARFVVRSSLDDAKALASRVAAARLRLSRR